MKIARERLEAMFVAMAMAEAREFPLPNGVLGHVREDLLHTFTDATLAEAGASPAAAHKPRKGPCHPTRRTGRRAVTTGGGRVRGKVRAL